MNNQIKSGDRSPDCWIKKESKSRPNHFYYFNTVTRVTQWAKPFGDKVRDYCKQLSKRESIDSSKRNGKMGEKGLKLSNESKGIKKEKRKTPAQDRLHNLTTQLKEGSDKSKKTNDSYKSCKSDTVRKTLHNSKPTNINASKSFSSKQPNIINGNGNNTVNATLSTEEIPCIFPPKTPSQDRLNRLRNSINPPIDNGLSTNVPTHHALNVIRNEFGLSDNNNDDVNASLDMDEPMDWEPCDIFEKIENTVYKDFIDLAYIVPDTNVFLDGMSSIRDTIQRESKYNVLVPFVVLQELDRLKTKPDDSRICNLASGAIKFIYNQLKSKSQRLQGQKATEDNRHIIDVKNADDKILNCCLQMTQQSRKVILLTNDINLSNKAIATGIETMSSKEYKV